MTTQAEAAQERVPGASAPFRRVLLKLSGEALLGSREFGISPSTVEAIASVSAADPTIWIPSRSHWTAAPVTKMAPSNAWVSTPSGERQAAVVSSPASLRTSFVPVLVRMNEPVP